MGQQSKKDDLNPLNTLDDWENDLLKRYPDPNDGKKKKEEFRNYEDSFRVDTVKEFYRLNHKYQTYDFVSDKEKELLKFDKREMSLWGCRRFSEHLG